MKTYQITVTAADLPYIIEAIGLRALTLQQAIQTQCAQPEIKSEIVVPPEAPKKRTRKSSKRDAVLKILAKNPNISTAELARRAEVSYVTAAKARK